MSQPTVRRLDPGKVSSPEAEWLDLLGSLAAQALTQVAQRIRMAPLDVNGLAVERLHAAAIGQDRQACSDVARIMMADGLAAERICDVYIPDAVRRMGEEWVTGELPFSTVTIGSARLQGLLRELDLGFVNRPERAAGAAGAILVVVPAGADHTLGPLVLASQLRRRGFSVRLSLGETADAAAESVATIRFDAVFLSATLARFVPDLARIANAIRSAVPLAPPIVLGGAAVAIGALTPDTAGDEAGDGASDGAGDASNGVDLSAIDHVTCDLDEALRLCGFAVAE